MMRLPSALLFSFAAALALAAPAMRAGPGSSSLQNQKSREERIRHRGDDSF